MKIEQFNQLCKTEWADGRGEVSALYLSEKSFDELYTDIFVNRAGPVSIVHPHWDLINPETKQQVSVKTIEGQDSMTIRYGGWKQNKTVTL